MCISGSFVQLLQVALVSAVLKLTTDIPVAFWPRISINFKVGVGQCSHQNLQAKGYKYYLMTTPIILNVVIVSTKHFLQVYHCQQSISSVQCSLSSILRAQTVFFYVQVVEVAVKNMLVLRWNQRAHYWFWGRPKGHIRGPKGHSALWKRPSENTGWYIET